MADDANTNQHEPNTNPDPQGAPQGESGDAPTNDSGKTYTEAEFNAMVATRLSKQEKALRKTLRDEIEAERKKAEMSEAERYKAEVEERDKRIQDLETKHREATMRAQLVKDVTDPDYALFKIQQAGDKYLTTDGEVNVDAFLKDHESQRAQPTAKTGPAPTTAGGGSARAFDMNAHIRQKAGRGQ